MEIEYEIYMLIKHMFDIHNSMNIWCALSENKGKKQRYGLVINCWSAFNLFTESSRVTSSRFLAADRCERKGH